MRSFICGQEVAMPGDRFHLSSSQSLHLARLHRVRAAAGLQCLQTVVLKGRA